MATIYPVKLPIDGGDITPVNGLDIDADNFISLEKTGPNTVESTSVLLLSVRIKSTAANTTVFIPEESQYSAKDYEDPRTRILEDNTISRSIPVGDVWTILISSYLTPSHVDQRGNRVALNFNSASDSDNALIYPVALRPSDIAAAGIG